jgi:hypothetical protein
MHDLWVEGLCSGRSAGHGVRVDRKARRICERWGGRAQLGYNRGGEIRTGDRWL